MSLNITKGELEELYWGGPGTEMGIYLIAEKLGCSPSTVYRHLKKHNIEIRPSTREGGNECMTKKGREKTLAAVNRGWEEGVYDFLKGKTNPNYKQPEISKQRLKELYINQKKSIYQIADKTGYSKNQIWKWLKRYNIKIRDNGWFSEKGLESKKEKAKQQQHLKGRQHPHYGKKYSKEERKKISQSVNNKINFENGVKIFKEYYNEDVSIYDLSDKYNISKQTIYRMVNCKHWTTKHLTDNVHSD